MRDGIERLVVSVAGVSETGAHVSHDFRGRRRVLRSERFGGGENVTWFNQTPPPASFVALTSSACSSACVS